MPDHPEPSWVAFASPERREWLRRHVESPPGYDDPTLPRWAVFTNVQAEQMDTLIEVLSEIGPRLQQIASSLDDIYIHM